MLVYVRSLTEDFRTLAFFHKRDFGFRVTLNPALSGGYGRGGGGQRFKLIIRDSYDWNGLLGLWQVPAV